MQNHGAIVVSDTIEHAAVEAMSLERCARIHLLAEAAGGTEIASAEVAAGRRSFRPLYLRNAWEANLLRILAPSPRSAGWSTTGQVPLRSGDRAGAAVGHDGEAGDEAGVVTEQEADDSADVLDGVPEAVLRAPTEHPFGHGRIAREGLGHRR